MDISNFFANNGIGNISPEVLLYILAGLIILLLITALLTSVFFILAQQKLVKRFSLVNDTAKISSLWLWSQLIAIWSYIALIVTANYLKQQDDIFINKSQNAEKGSHFKVSYSYWYVGSIVLTIIPSISIIAGLVNMIMFVVVWVNISKTTKFLIKTSRKTIHN